MGCCSMQCLENEPELLSVRISSETKDCSDERSTMTEVTPSCSSYRAESQVKVQREKFVPSACGTVSCHYALQQELGVGAYGRVYQATHLRTGATRAVKVIPKERLNTSTQRQLLEEVRILKKLDHPYVLKLHESLEDDKEISLVTELCTGGSLFERIVQQSRLSEQQTARLIFQILSALCYCHSNQIVHRDLKPENILFENDDEDSSLKVIDFGIATTLEEREHLNNFIGTVRLTQVYYVAPEVIQGCYTEKCDVWSCGVLLYIMLSGKPPFAGDSKQAVLKQILRGVYTFQDTAWATVSREAKQFVKRMLTRDPQFRPSARSLLKDPWIQQAKSEVLGSRWLSSTTLQNLVRFQGTSKIRHATLNYLVCQAVTRTEVGDLHKIFLGLDANKDGHISEKELIDGFQRLELHTKYNVGEILKWCDSDNNGYIEYTEFLASAINWNTVLSHQKLLQAFEACDADQNGKISLEELKVFIGDENISEEVWTKIFLTADFNKDGFIDIDEFKTLVFQGSWPPSS